MTSERKQMGLAHRHRFSRTAWRHVAAGCVAGRPLRTVERPELWTYVPEYPTSGG